MTDDKQIRRLLKLIHTEKTQEIAASKAGMDVKTARKYLRSRKLPSEMKGERYWRTRPDPFKEHWEEVCHMLEVNPGLKAVTLFGYLQRQYPGRYQDGQRRTFQDRVKIWKALNGPPKEVFFPQKHYPGRLCQSDFTRVSDLGITLTGQPFPHLIYHFVLTYSNWENGSICFSESFESLSEGLQNALWELGGVPTEHRSDQFSAAVHQLSHPEEFTQRYRALLNHYKLSGKKIQVAKPNENGDVEQSHYRFKESLDQSLMLRGSRDFATREAYAQFLRLLFSQLNAGRRERLKEEMSQLKALPQRRLDACKREKVRVRPSSTVRLDRNTYSVDSRLIGEWVEGRLYAESVQIWYARQWVDTLPRLRGRGKHAIDYRHIIDWLIRKPGAFENYLYRADLFPNSRFRMAYDALGQSKEYLKILTLAAKESETRVDEALHFLLSQETPISYAAVVALVRSPLPLPSRLDVQVADVKPAAYDTLLSEWGGPVCLN